MNNLFLNRYPYTDFHELNLSWLIQVITEVQKTLEDFVAINALKYADPIQWNITTQYEKNTIVIDPVSGVAYISVQPVPSGVALTNTTYWTVVFDLGQFIVRASKNFSVHYEADTTTTATFASTANDWLVWGDILYKALVNITPGDTYVVNGNIEHFTMEELIGHLEDLNTTDKSSIVNAINEALYRCDTLYLMINDLSGCFATKVETSNVATFNSNANDWIIVNEKLFKATTTVSIGDTYEVGTNITAFTIEDLTGHLEDLTTTDKTNIVSAINEVDDHADQAINACNSIFVNTGMLRKVICIGDSYLGGSGIAYMESDSWGAKLRALLDNSTNTILNGYGGSGFVGLVPSKTYIILLQEVASTLTDDEKLGISDIVVQGGINDKTAVASSLCTFSDVSDAINAFTAYAHSTFPNATIRIGAIGWATDGFADKLYWGKTIECYKHCANSAGNAANKVQYMSGTEYIMPTIYDNEYYDTIHPDVGASLLIARGIYNCMMGGNGDLGHTVSNASIAITWEAGITEVARNLTYDIYGNIATIRPRALFFNFASAVNYTFGTPYRFAIISDGSPVRASLGIKIPVYVWVEHSGGLTADTYPGFLQIKNGELSLEIGCPNTGTDMQKCWIFGGDYSDSVFNIC